jgi:hypothetical protein
VQVSTITFKTQVHPTMFYKSTWALLSHKLQLASIS